MVAFDVTIVIPVCNPNAKFLELLSNIQKQTVEFSVLIIDSGQNDYYRQCIDELNCNIRIKKINATEFNHGGTRQLGMILYPQSDIYVFLTQDAILADEFAIANLLAVFCDDKVGAAYGRQIPHKDASLFARITREINYDRESHIYSLTDKEKYGIKTCFMSNSFAAYRRISMENVRGFPSNTILCEDMYVAAKMLMNGWKLAYASDACVYHSHNYTIVQEFKRYFDIGVFHTREKWIRKNFGEAEGEGKRFILYEIKQIMHQKPYLIAEMFCRDIAKWCGYRLGMLERFLPMKIKKIISMNARYWSCSKGTVNSD